ncbi:MAG: anti-sigma factor antagonist [Syntrophobacteraceae bacterium]|nr:anti-sigma factor antagonist [Syntrophobacteraceae bacterium]
MDSLEILQNFVRQRVDHLAPSADLIQEIRLVVEELFANIVFYAYPDKPGTVRVRCFLDSAGSFCVRFIDWGIPFNPLTFEPPDLEEDFTDREIGGLGIHLVRQLAHDIRYIREENLNVLTVCFQMKRNELLMRAHPDGREKNMPLTLTSMEKQPGVYVVSPFGSLDTNTHTILEKKIDYLIAEGGARVVTLDMAGVEYISSMGVRVVLKTKKDLKACGGTLLMANLQPQIKRVFEIINALPSLQIFSSIQELDEYLAEMQRQAIHGSIMN